MPITREELYEQIWTKPMIEVAKGYDVSSSYLARICSDLRVPRPGRGYWARRAAGKSVSKAPLPKARPGDEQIWAPDVPHWRRHAFANEAELVLPSEVPAEPVALVKSKRRHPMLVDVEALFRNGQHRRDGYLRPAKRNLPDINVSEKRLEAAVSVANALYMTLESRGHSVVFAPRDQVLSRRVPEFPVDAFAWDERSRWEPNRPTMVFIGHVAIGIAIIELATEQEAERVDDKWVPANSPEGREKRRQDSQRTWLLPMPRTPDLKALPSGELQVLAYCPYRDAKWSRQWTAPTASKLREQVPDIVTTIEGAVPQLVKDIEAGRKRREEEERLHEIEMEKLRAKWAEEERQRLIEQTRKKLLEIAREWVETEEIRRFLMEVETAVEQLAGEPRAELEARLLLARRWLHLPTAAEQLLSWLLPAESIHL